MNLFPKSDNLVVRELDDELVILDTKTGFVHVLNSTGKIIWYLLDELDSVDDIVTALMALYANSNLSVVQSDVTEITDDLIENGLISPK